MKNKKLFFITLFYICFLLVFSLFFTPYRIEQIISSNVTILSERGFSSIFSLPVGGSRSSGLFTVNIDYPILIIVWVVLTASYLVLYRVFNTHHKSSDRDNNQNM